MGTGEDGEFAVSIALGFGLRVQCVTGDDDGRGVCGGPAGLRDTAGCGCGEIEERGEVFCCVLFDKGEDGGDLVDVDLEAVRGDTFENR